MSKGNLGSHQVEVEAQDIIVRLLLGLVGKRRLQQLFLTWELGKVGRMGVLRSSDSAVTQARGVVAAWTESEVIGDLFVELLRRYPQRGGVIREARTLWLDAVHVEAVQVHSPHVPSGSVQDRIGEGTGTADGRQGCRRNHRTVDAKTAFPPNTYVGPIHFEDFSGKQFERLVFAYLCRKEPETKWTWYGQTGADGGRDIWGERPGGAAVCYACANWRGLTLTKVKEDLEKLAKLGGKKPNEVVVVAGGEVPAGLRDRALVEAKKLGLHLSGIWSGAEFEEYLRRDAESLLRRFMGGEVFPDAAGAIRDEANLGRRPVVPDACQPATSDVAQVPETESVGETMSGTETWDIFVAYAGPDRTQAQGLVSELRGKCRVRWDGDHTAGTPFDEIRKDIEQSRVVVFLSSSASERAWYQQDEIARVISLVRQHSDRHHIVPVLLEDGVSPPYGLAHLIPIRAWHERGTAGIAGRLLSVLGSVTGSAAGTAPGPVVRPPGFLDALPFDFARPDSQSLLALFVGAYGNLDEARALAEDAGIDCAGIHWQRSMRFVWRDIVRVARDADRLWRLIGLFRIDESKKAYAQRLTSLVGERE